MGTPWAGEILDGDEQGEGRTAGADLMADVGASREISGKEQRPEDVLLDAPARNTGNRAYQTDAERDVISLCFSVILIRLERRVWWCLRAVVSRLAFRIAHRCVAGRPTHSLRRRQEATMPRSSVRSRLRGPPHRVYNHLPPIVGLFMRFQAA